MIFHNGCVADVLIGDCLDSLRGMAAESMHTCVTSPPYFGLRDYGNPAQIGLEPTPAEFIAKLVEVFGEVRRVLRNDGTLWLNMGDSYAGSGRGGNPTEASSTLQGSQISQEASIVKRARNDVSDAQRVAAVTQRGSRLPAGFHETQRTAGAIGRAWVPPPAGFKNKDLIGVPWRLAFALHADGWYLRQDVVWSKPNPMPESTKDRCTKAHEYLFLLAKSEHYYFDNAAIQEPVAASTVARMSQDVEGQEGSDRVPGKSNGPMRAVGNGRTRNKRSVWTVPTRGFKGAHFATFPPALIEPCVLAGSPPGGFVLDPFGGSGTTAAVALKHGRNALLCELNPEYAALMPARVESLL